MCGEKYHICSSNERKEKLRRKFVRHGVVTRETRVRSSKFRNTVILDLVISYGVFHTTTIIRILEIGPVTIQI